MTILDLKNQLDNTSSNSDKVKILEEYFNQHDATSDQLIKTIHDPLVKFGLTISEYKKQIKEAEMPLSTHNLTIDCPEKVVLDILNNLANLQPNITKDIIIPLTKYYYLQDQEVYKLLCCGLQRYLSKGTNINLINKAYRSINNIDLIPTFSVALAEDATNKDLRTLISKNEDWYFSRKIDGQRTIFNSKNQTFYSRSGNEIESLSNYSFQCNNLILDGEIAYVEKTTGIESFKLTEMLIRRKNYKLPKVLWWSTKGDDEPTETKTDTNVYQFELTYFVFDILKQEEFFDKVSKVRLTDRLQRTIQNNNIVKILEQKHLEFDETTNQFNIEQEELPEGWEGYMLRKNCDYKGKRSKDMYKLKQFYDTELICEDVEMTIKRMQNLDGSWTDRECIGALLCKYKTSKVKVGSGLTDFDRLKKPEDYIGQLIKIKYTQKIVDKNGVEHLRHPVFICIRDKSDM